MKNILSETSLYSVDKMWSVVLKYDAWKVLRLHSYARGCNGCMNALVATELLFLVSRHSQTVWLCSCSLYSLFRNGPRRPKGQGCFAVQRYQERFLVGRLREESVIRCNNGGFLGNLDSLWAFRRFSFLRFTLNKPLKLILLFLTCKVEITPIFYYRALTGSKHLFNFFLKLQIVINFNLNFLLSWDIF